MAFLNYNMASRQVEKDVTGKWMDSDESTAEITVCIRICTLPE